MSFVPETWKPESGGNSRYTKMKENEAVKLRILSKSAILARLRWTTENKPIRWRDNEPEPTRTDWREGEHAKQVFILNVYNYTTKQIEVWEIPQKSIQATIVDFAKHEDYGDPTGYDFTIKRTGKGLETEYSVMPSPPKAINKEVEEALLHCVPDLEELFVGGDPFKNCS